MKCPTCNEVEIIKICQKEKVKLQCKKGHCWYENYKDQGGPHSRPQNYNIKLEDVLFPSEKVIYQKVLTELEKSKSFYSTADPIEKTKLLVKNCGIEEKELYCLFKKIVDFENNQIEF